MDEDSDFDRNSDSNSSGQVESEVTLDSNAGEVESEVALDSDVGQVESEVTLDSDVDGVSDPGDFMPFERRVIERVEPFDIPPLPDYLILSPPYL